MTDAHLSTDGRTLTVRVPMTFRTRGGRKIVIPPDGAPSLRQFLFPNSLPPSLVGLKTQGSAGFWAKSC